MQIQFNNSEKAYPITSYRLIGQNLIILTGESLPPENASGFKLLLNGKVQADYSAFTTKYNILTPLADTIMLSNNETIVETPDSPASLYCYTPTDAEIQEMLEQTKEERIRQSKKELADYLASHPLVTTVHNDRSGTYSVTAEKQALMMNRYTTFQAEKMLSPNAKLVWNETGEPCEEWTEEEFLRLISEVKKYVLPLVTHQQNIEKAINSCVLDDELDAIVIDYSHLSGGDFLT